MIRPGYKWAPWKYSNWRLLNWQQAQWNIFKTLLNSRSPLLESIFGRWWRQTTDVCPMQAVGSVWKADLDTHSQPNKGPWSHFKGVTMRLPPTEEQGLSLYLTRVLGHVCICLCQIQASVLGKRNHRDYRLPCSLSWVSSEPWLHVSLHPSSRSSFASACCVIASKLFF